jgi:Peptidase family M23
LNLAPLPLVAAIALTVLRAGGSPEIRREHQFQHSSDFTTAKQDGQNATGSRGETAQPLTAPLDIRVPVAPWSFRANNKWNLVYELHIANIGSETCTLKQISVLGLDNNPKLLARLTEKDLESAIAHPWVDQKAPATIGPANLAVVFMWVNINDGDEVPVALSHRITMRVGSYPEDLSITMPALNVNRKPVPVIGPPLRGADWGAAHGPSNDSHHRRGLLTIDGQSYIAERYAIDWVRITPSGDAYTGGGKVNQDFPGYGADVLAVADGTITEVTDGVPENVPGQAPVVPISLKNICGNHVIERLGGSLYASYCHLQSGLKLTPGTKVKRGQVLGLVGNSGSSDGPHLHFQMCNAGSTLACEGVPYAFSSFGEEHKDFHSPSDTKPQPETVHSIEIPTNETLVDFY